MKSGILILDKGEGMTSQGAISRLRRLLGADKVGHTGTLDPMATGVLPVLIGRAVKASEFLLCAQKHYEAILTLGITTDTEDITGNILSVSDRLPAEEEVYSVLSRFRGEILQTPPMYSALKVGGKKLCDLARRGIEVERTPRPITVYSLSAKRLDEKRYALDVICSKGTYIRTLCADIGAALGVGGVMSALRRVEASGYTLADTHTLEEIEALAQEDRWNYVLPTETIFQTLPKISLSPFFARLARAGLSISNRKIGLRSEVGARLRMADEGGFFALGEVMECDGEPVLKPIRQFDV